eukprot:m.89852 g.89852  ORF g.89852 m.89852 type:complete len:93 (-) comp14594_c0_seq2:74-352(-)
MLCAPFQLLPDETRERNHSTIFVLFWSSENSSRPTCLSAARRVKIESSFTSIMIGIMVAEGVGRSLDPEVDLLKLAAPILLREKAKLAFSGR